MRLIPILFILITTSLIAQQTVVTCPTGQVPESTITGALATVICKAVTPPPVTPPVLSNVTADPQSVRANQPVILNLTITGGAPPLVYTVRLGSTNVPFTTVSDTELRIVATAPSGNKLYTVTVTDALKRQSSRQVTVIVTNPIVQIWGNVTPLELGECSVTDHDRHIIDGNDGWFYRVWHPQIEPSGCAYGHEHGDDPNLQTNAWVRANWDPRMGYAARRVGDMEPHNGYKVHVTNIGEMNDEGRINKTATTSTPHMGTGGPARFSVDLHSVSITDWHENGIHHTSIHTMFATGTTGNPICTNRVNAPTKDGLILGMKCKMDSSYEIWGMVLDAKRANGDTLLMKFVTPAVFDPITVHNPANPTEVVYSWDSRVANYKNFPNDWSGFRGCAREGYSQVGYHYNGNDPSEEYLLDVRTNRIVTVASEFTTRLVVGRSNTGGNPPFSSNILQFKKRRDHCDFRNKLSLTN
jgi:hypothetical protein